MSRKSLALLLLLAPTLSLADIVTLECKGVSPSGKQETVTVKFDDVANWVEDSSALKYRDGVATNFLTSIRIFIDRQSGEYETRKTTAGEKFKGTCAAKEPRLLTASLRF
jgi:hypothetical protein